MKRIVLLLSVVILAFSSCSKNEDAPAIPIVDSNGILLKKTRTRLDIDLTNTYPSYSYTYFQYDGNKIVKTYYYENETDFNGCLYTYSDNLITKIDKYSFGHKEAEEIFEYNSEQKVVRYTFNNLAFNSGEVFNYTYNFDNTISFNKRIWDLYNSPRLTATGKIYSDRYEFTEIAPLSNDTKIFKFVRDGKNNPLKNILGYDKICMIRLHSDLFLSGFEQMNIDSTQNIINMLEVTQLGDLSTFGFSTFTYNIYNYPIKMHYSNYETTSYRTIDYYYE